MESFSQPLNILSIESIFSFLILLYMFLNRSHEVTIFEKHRFQFLHSALVVITVSSSTKAICLPIAFSVSFAHFLVYACLFAPQLRMSHFHQNPFVTKQNLLLLQ